MYPEDHRTPLFRKHLQNFYLEPGTSVLMIRDSTHTSKLVVPYKLTSRFLYQAHDCINHSGVTRMRAHLARYWWENKNQDIEAYIESCENCAKRKGNYGKRQHWPTSHCKRRKKSFDTIYVDFVSMSVWKGKRFTVTILDNFNRHLTAIPYVRDCAIDAARRLYSFFRRQREIWQIISSDRRTYFTGEVYKYFGDMMSNTRELYCPWRPQSSGNIERQHRTMKNALFMQCDDRNCEWTNILESVTSSMNATINSATGVSPHYVIIGR